MGSDYRILDVDIHHQYPSPTALTPYLNDPQAIKYYGGGTLGVPNVRGAYRQDSYPPAGGQPGSDPQFMVENHFDRFGIELGILNSFRPRRQLLAGVAADIARACNDWTIEEWFPVDERLLGSITISASDPDQAADGDPAPRFAPADGAGHARPACPACSATRSCIRSTRRATSSACPSTSTSAAPTAGSTAAATASGKPTSFMEYHTGFTIPAQHHLISLVTEGVFVKYPNVRVVFNEFGVAWLPFIMWRMDMEYRAGREDVPWLTQAPERVHPRARAVQHSAARGARESAGPRQAAIGDGRRCHADVRLRLSALGLRQPSAGRCAGSRRTGSSGSSGTTPREFYDLEHRLSPEPAGRA